MEIQYRTLKEAYIIYDENSEQERADMLFDKLERLGWKVEQEEGCACIPVYSKRDYLSLLCDYVEILWRG